MKFFKIVGIVLVFLTCLILANTDKPNKYYNNSRQILEEGAPFVGDMKDGEMFAEEDNVRYGEFEFSGGVELYDIDFDNNTKLNITYSLITEQGVSKLVLITAKDEIITLVENVDPKISEGETEVEVPAGNNRIKLICKNEARGEIFVCIE